MVSRRVGSPVRQRLIQMDQMLRDELHTELYNTGQDILTDLQYAVVSWRRRPNFRAQIRVSRHLLAVEVSPDRHSKAGKIFVWVDKGTGVHGPHKRPYIIRPRPRRRGGKGYLKFQTDYLPKSLPVAKGAKAARVNVGPGVAIGPWVQTESVLHPGIEPRRITEAAVNNLKPSFQRRIENAIRRAVNRAARSRR